MQKANQVKEERVAAEAGVELCALATLNDVSLWRERNWRIDGERYGAVARRSDTRKVGPGNGSELVARRIFRRKYVLKDDLGPRIAVDVDECFVYRVGTEFGGVRRR